MRVKIVKRQNSTVKFKVLIGFIDSIQAASHLASKGEFQRAAEMKSPKRQVKRLFQAQATYPQETKGFSVTDYFIGAEQNMTDQKTRLELTLKDESVTT